MWLRYLHDAVPVVTSCDAKQRQKRDAKVAEVGVFIKTFARISERTL